MKKYYLLSKAKYVKKIDEEYSDLSPEKIIDREYENRKNSYSFVGIDFEIQPFSKTKQERLMQKYPLFYIILPEHLKMIEQIYKQSRQIRTLLKTLPQIAKDKIQISQMMTEIISSNDIEGVQSTRKELEDAIDAQYSNRKVRFKSVIRQYLSALFSKKPHIKQLKDIREIYDEVVIDEISEENLPDGELFRNGFMAISGSSLQFVHIGDVNEEEIKEDLTQLINYMNSSDDTDIVKSIVTHYIFEYIHPFYDGNGRMGRYLLSSYLAYKLDPFSAFSISSAIKNNKKIYENAFAEVSNPLNRAEITLFISEMMKIIIRGQQDIRELLSDAIDNIELAVEYLKSEKFDEVEKAVEFIMLQHYLFASEKNLTNKEIYENLKENYSRRKVDNTLKILEEKNYVRQVSKNPIAYELTREKLPMFN